MRFDSFSTSEAVYPFCGFFNYINMSKITRQKRNTPFVQIDKNALQDERLSWKAKGLLAYLLSLPDDWQIYINELKNHAKDGRDSTRTAMNELIKFGYIHRSFSDRDGGKFTGFDYFVTEKPITKKPKTEKPKSVNPTLLIRDNTNKENTNNTIKEKSTKKVEAVPVSDSSPLQTPKNKKEKVAPKRKKLDIDSVEFPAVFLQNPELLEAFRDFYQMRKDIKKGYKTRKAVETKLRSLAKDCDRHGVETVTGAILFSLESEYLGIFVHDYAKKQQQNEKQSANYTKPQPTNIHEDFKRRLQERLNKRLSAIDDSDGTI